MWKNVQRTMEQRERLERELEILGVQVFPSSANFLLIRSKLPALVEKLRNSGILVMDVSRQLGEGFIRLTVGTPEENQEFLRAYRMAKDETGIDEVSQSG